MNGHIEPGAVVSTLRGPLTGGDMHLHLPGLD